VDDKVGRADREDDEVGGADSQMGAHANVLILNQDPPAKGSIRKS
jgi:hypothetical protein